MPRPIAPTRRPLLSLLLCAGASLLLPGAALADYGPKRGVYGGKATGATVSKRVHPTSVFLSSDGKEIAQLRLTAPAACKSGTQRNSPEAWTEVKIARDGSFSDGGEFDQRSADGSVVITWSSKLKGRLTARGGRGTSRDVATVRDRDGNVTDTCDTGVVRFRLARGPRVFGGSLLHGAGFPAFGARFPVSAVRNRRATELTNFRVRYMAKCGTTNHHTNSFEHSDVAVNRSGEFSTSRKFAYRSKTGTTRYTGRFTLRGRLGARRASGTYRVKFSARLADGTVIPCDTGRRKWSASQR